MIKENAKGITMVSLAITIVLLIILASVSVYYGGDVIKNAKLESLNTNMLLIQAKAKVIYEESTFNKDETMLKGTKVSEITDNEKITKLVNDKVIDPPEDYYLLTQEILDEIGLYNIEIEDGYIVNYKTEEVISVKGFKKGNNTYYKLSETKGLIIE